MSINHDHLHWQTRLILDVKGRSKGDDLDVLLQPDLACELMRDLLEPRAKAEDVIPFSVNRNTAERFPR